MVFWDRFKKEQKLKPEERVEVLLNLLHTTELYHDFRIVENKSGERGIYAFTNVTEMKKNSDWFNEGRALTKSNFQEIAENLRSVKEIDCIVINPFSDVFRISRAYFLDKMTLPNFFDFPKNQEGVQQVYTWLHENNVYVFCKENGKPELFTANEEIYIVAHTNEASINHEIREDEKYVEMNFSELCQIFIEFPEFCYLMINPNSDAVQINRIGFTKKEKVTNNGKLFT
ncbi:hypothetical protein FACS1894192_09920 [Bacilli bacterium]|nr:hypothetical protein FACS1894192_09920 [Bacilli bacterium]